MKSLSRAGIACLLTLLFSFTLGCGSSRDISARVARWRTDLDTPALALAVVNSEGTLRLGTSGSRIANGTEKVTENDLWFIGSSSKTMTATLAALLVQDGKITWNTTVGESFSDLPDILPEYKKVTLTDLLSHRSGLPGFDTPDQAATVPTDFEGDLLHQRISLANWMLQQTPVNTPKTAVVYSNLGYFVAAVMLERASGQTWEENLRTRLLKPLGLTVKFGLPGTGASNAPWGHTWIDNKWKSIDPNDSASEIPLVANPIGNVSMSLADYAKWAQINLAGLRGKDTSTLKAETIKKLHTVIDGSADGSGQALAWYKNTLNNHVLSSALGSDGTFYGTILLDPERNRGVVILTNGTKDALDPDPVLDGIIDLAEKQLKE